MFRVWCHILKKIIKLGKSMSLLVSNPNFRFVQIQNTIQMRVMAQQTRSWEEAADSFYHMAISQMLPEAEQYESSSSIASLISEVFEDARNIWIILTIMSVLINIIEFKVA